MTPGDITFFFEGAGFAGAKRGKMMLWSRPFTTTVDFSQTGVLVDACSTLLVLAVQDRCPVSGASEALEQILGRDVLVVGGGTWGWTTELSLVKKASK